MWPMAALILAAAVTFATSVRTSAAADLSAPLANACEHEVFCSGGPGSILHTVQMARVFEDSKTFVDRPMKVPKMVVARNFRRMMQVKLYLFQ